MRPRWVAVLSLGILLALTLSVKRSIAVDADVWTRVQDYIAHKKYTDAIRLLTPPANDGDSLAQFALGTVYEQRGQGAKDFESALAWYQSAAELGHPAAAAYAADMFRWGKGTPVSDERAVIYYRQAAASKNIGGVLGLAQMLEEGRGTTKDVPAAIQLYSEISEHSDRALHRLNGMILSSDRKDVNHEYSDVLCYAFALQALRFTEYSRDLAKRFPEYWVTVRAPGNCSMNWAWKYRDWKVARKSIEAWATSASETNKVEQNLPTHVDVVVQEGDKFCLRVEPSLRRLKVLQQGHKLSFRDANGIETIGAIFGNQIVIVTGLTLEDRYRATEAGVVVAYGEWNGRSANLTNTLGSCKLVISR